MRTLGRRAFLILAGMLSPLAHVRGFSQPRPAAATTAAPIGLDDFLRISARLTERTTLDRTVAQTYLTALLSVAGNSERLADLSRPGASRARTPAQVALEQQILASWYTGTYDRDGQRRLATHTGALMWSALRRPAPGACASGPAPWSRPPQAAAR